jgi:hypothetical protein
MIEGLKLKVEGLVQVTAPQQVYVHQPGAE